MKPREFHLDAWQMATHNGYPGCVSICAKAMQHGYQLGLADATKEFREAIDKAKEKKERSNNPI